MVKVRGDAILDHLTKIDDPQNSELVAYLRKLLNSGIGKENAVDSIKNGNKPTSAGGKIPRFTKSDHDALAEIFKKIGQWFPKCRYFLEKTVIYGFCISTN